MKKFLVFVLAVLVTMAAFNARPVAAADNATAIFSGGCFWCMHAAFEQLPGVTKVSSGYTGGNVANPTYEQVSSGQTGHVEAIRVLYDPERLAYTKLLEWFWDNVDPNDPNGQFCDKGSQYLAGIFYSTPMQKEEAEKSIARLEQKLKQKTAVFLRPAKEFYEAEDYHQQYYKKNKISYNLYKMGCGREQILEKIRQKE